MKKIAVYGSLKTGFYNHDRFNMGELVATAKIRGAMFLCYSYPHLFRVGVEGIPEEQYSYHDVEIYEVDDATYSSILGMELGAGYQEYQTNLAGHDVTIFYSRDDLDYRFHWLSEYSENTVPQAVSR